MNRWTRASSRIGAVALLSAALGAPVCAEEGEGKTAVREAETPITTTQPAPGFYRSHFLPKLQSQFQYQLPMHVQGLAGRDVTDDLLYDQLHDAGRRGFERATRKSLEDYLLEQTSLDDVIDNIGRRNRNSGQPNAARPGRDTSFHFGVRVSHALPALDVRRRLGSGGMFRMRINALGDVGFSVNPNKWSIGYFGGGYSLEREEFHLDLRIGL